jgi:hypothetical protein
LKTNYSNLETSINSLKTISQSLELQRNLLLWGVPVALIIGFAAGWFLH